MLHLLYCHHLPYLALLSPLALHVLFYTNKIHVTKHITTTIHHYAHISYQMVMLPTLSNKVVQTSSETTLEGHVGSAVEDVK
jgi:hypothetical protein